MRNLSHSEGGFFSAEDAESAPDDSSRDQKEEGVFYVWTKTEIDRILSPEEASILEQFYGVEESGNVKEDPHHVFDGRNILFAARTVADIARDSSRSESDVNALLRSAEQKLFDARNKRPHPHLDDKILTSWNGLMISAFARGYQILGESRYLDAAVKSAQFILSRLRDNSSGELFHRFRDGEARFEGQLDDYACIIQSLLDLYEASFDIEWLYEALTLARRQNQLFYDEENGGFFDTTGRDPSVLVRTKEWYDGAEPSGNSIAILNLLRLAHYTNDQSLAATARKSLSFFGERLLNAAHAAPQLLAALDFSLSKATQIIIVGSENDPHTADLLREIHSHFLPGKIMILADVGAGQATLSSFIPFVETLKKIDDRPTVYVCENYSCQLPTSDPAILSSLLSRAGSPIAPSIHDS